MKKAYYIPLLLLIVQTVFGQKAQTLETDTFLYNFYSGQLKFNFVVDSNENIIKTGIYTFDSKMNQTIKNDQVYLEKLNVSGQFSDNKKDKTWSYHINKYFVNINDVQGSWKYTLNYNLDGEHLTYRFNFNKGVPTGLWTLKSTEIKNGILQKEKTYASLSYQNGLLSNNFNLDYSIPEHGFSFVRGSVNTEGFVDGDLLLEYVKNDQTISETRKYKNGFLISIEKKNKNTDSVLVFIQYDDVLEKLAELETNSESLNYTISTRGFGIEFDNGYQRYTPKIREQQDGNFVLFQLFHLFDMCFIEDTVCYDKPDVNFTRRFKFIYPESDDSMQVVLRERIDHHTKKLNDFVDNPKYIINKQKSDSLSYFYAYLKHSLSKINIIDDVVTKVEDGYFDFLYRPNYYRNGVPELNRTDSIEYSYNGKTIIKEFNSPVLITAPENLLIQLNNYITENKKITENYIELTNSKIKTFEKQEKIDSIETEIVRLSHLTDSLYGRYLILHENKELKDMPIAYKVYKSTYNRLIEKQSKEFINTENFEEKITLGKKLICLYKTLTDNYDEFANAEEFSEWINKKFTIYQKNPFDERLFESKILGNIEKSGRILYKYYVDEVLKANACSVINENIENLQKLKKQLDYFVNTNNEEIQRLNKALRSESVPSRIERLFYTN